MFSWLRRTADLFGAPRSSKWPLPGLDEAAVDAAFREAAKL